MHEFSMTILLASVVAGAAPVVLATLGETISEKAGMINLSLDGSLLLSAMVAFVVALKTNSLLLGFTAAALTGGLVALLIALCSIYLELSQVAVGFVLTLTCRDLAYFLGNPFARMHGPQVAPWSIPGLSEIPFLGPVFFSHNLTVYLSLFMMVLIWWYFYKTPQGLVLRAVGENPAAAFTRGLHPRRTQLFYAVVGGMLVGLAGATFSLSTKAGWGRPQGCEGTGWIALALVIFGGWHPVKTAFGAYLFSFLQVMGIHFQTWFPTIPTQVFQVAPFPLMIFTLLIMGLSQKERVIHWASDKPWARSVLTRLADTAPGALGKSFRPDIY